MKVLIVHNEYGKFSGEEAVVQSLSRLLVEHEHQIHHFSRSSAEIPGMQLGNIRAFFSGLYSFSSRKAMRRCLQEFKPDIVHVHNLFPFISPSVLGVCRRARVPVVMTVHNYRLMCPNGLHMNNGKICEKCCRGREWWCILQNCEKSLFKSIGYALRNYIARTLRLFHDNVTMYTCLAVFQKRRLIAAGFPESHIAVIPNMFSFSMKGNSSPGEGEYVSYVGRLSEEKGLLALFEAARASSNIPFKIAGTGPLDISPTVKSANCELVGFLAQDKLIEFYQNSRFLVFPSICYEPFGLTIVEAMLHGKAVIASNIGGIPEIVEDGVTGLLFEPGNVEDLAEKIRYLWEQLELCRQMGQAGREKAIRQYSPEKYYSRLMDVYDKAVDFGFGGSAHQTIVRA